MSSLKSIVGAYLGHLVAYVVASAGVVAAIDPKLIPPQGAFAVALAGLVTAAAHHGYQAGVATQVVQAVTNAVNTSAAKLVLACLLVAPMLVAPMLVLGGCSSVPGFLTSPSSAPFVKAAVDIAVATAEAKGISPSTINTIAHKALDADENATTTLAAISAVVQSEIQALKLPVADQAAADVLLAALSASLQTQLADNPTAGQIQTAARVVINDVIAITGG